jgi:hypothetical protein
LRIGLLPKKEEVAVFESIQELLVLKRQRGRRGGGSGIEMSRGPVRLCHGLGKKWQNAPMCKWQRHGNAGHLAQQFSACSATVSMVFDPVTWRQYHFAHSKQTIDLSACICLSRMLPLTVHALSGAKQAQDADSLDAE